MLLARYSARPQSRSGKPHRLLAQFFPPISVSGTNDTRAVGRRRFLSAGIAIRCRPLPFAHGNAVVCDSFSVPAACMKCGKPSTRHCDWKISSIMTCDVALCDDCTHETATDMDLCPRHSKAWTDYQVELKQPRKA